jgi:hypothetical protein
VANAACTAITTPTLAWNRLEPTTLPSSAPQNSVSRELTRSTAVRPLYSFSNCTASQSVSSRGGSAGTAAGRSRASPAPSARSSSPRCTRSTSDSPPLVLCRATVFVTLSENPLTPLPPSPFGGSPSRRNLVFGLAGKRPALRFVADVRHPVSHGGLALQVVTEHRSRVVGAWGMKTRKLTFSGGDRAQFANTRRERRIPPPRQPPHPQPPHPQHPHPQHPANNATGSNGRVWGCDDGKR